ncbi:hypothetical protein LCGC14_1416520 [marine sediment metagenome]|uniref:DUF7417 domain-containing protein n=1 Tax=marine sediment metagenome TaxID=412755 RepID=A0A0F9KDW3_9ZZZZ
MPTTEELMNRVLQYEMKELDDAAVIDLFQDLVDTGMAWNLQGIYGRTACELISLGYIDAPNDLPRRIKNLIELIS